MIRRALAVLTALTLLALPVAAGAASEPEPSTAGTATTSLTLASLVIDGLPVDLDAADLGALVSYASTDTDPAMNDLGDGVPFALSSLALPVVGDIVARSDGDTGRDGRTIALDDIGTLTAGAMTATVSDGVASSVIEPLTASLSTLAGGLAVGVPQGGATSLVDPEKARAANGAVLSDLRIGLTDIIPLELLEQLPLDVLLGLIGDLPLDIDLDGLTGQVRELVADILDLADLQGRIAAVDAQLDPALQQLAAVEAQLPGLADALSAAQAAVTPAASAVTTATADLTAREAELDAARAAIPPLQEAVDDALADLATVGGTCPSDLYALLCTTLSSAQEALEAGEAAVAAAEAAVTAAEKTLADAQAALESATAAVTEAQSALDAAEALKDTLVETIADLEQTLTDLIDQLVDVVDDLLALLPQIDVDELLATVEALIEGLAGLELLAIDEVLVGVTSAASADGSAATALCDVSGVRLLGQARTVGSCVELEGVLGQLEIELAEILSALPLEVVGGATDLVGGAVQVGGLTTSTTPDDTRAGDYHHAAAAIEGLSIQVLPLELTQVTDGLVAELTDLLDGALGELAGLTGLDPALVADIGTVEDLLGTLVGVLDQLPTGDLLGSARTAGLSLEALDMGSESTFAAAGAGAPVPGGPTTPTPNVGTPTGPTPQTPTPQTPTPRGNLPATGGGAAGLALLLLGVGGGSAWALRSGRR